MVAALVGSLLILIFKPPDRCGKCSLGSSPSPLPLTGRGVCSLQGHLVFNFFEVIFFFSSLRILTIGLIN